MPTPNIPTKAHFNFTTALDMTVREGILTPQGKVLAGVQWTSWQRDELIWNFRDGLFGGDDKGKEFLRAIPKNLRVNGGTEEVDGIDPLARIPAGDIGVLCEINYEGSFNKIKHVEFRLYNCATEAVITAIVPTGGSATYSHTFSNVTAGSYVLWARVFDTLIVDDPLQNAGEWAALKIRVGAGSFSVGAGISPNPGCPLYAKNQADAPVSISSANEATYRVPFDPLARSITASCVTFKDTLLRTGDVDIPQGSQIIAGLRSSRSGSESAMWLLNSDMTARLLATSENFSGGKCECGKADHHASDVAQHPNGTLYLLSECSLHQYEPDKPTIGERLPSSPEANGGDPGGQCLRFPRGALCFFTEAFDKAADLGTYLYNRLIDRRDGRDNIGAGTCWNGPCVGEVINGLLYGFRAVGKPKEGGKIVFGAMQNGVWLSGGIEYDPKETFWRQVRRAGSKIFFFGHKPGVLNGRDTPALDTPVFAYSDGKRVQQIPFVWFARRATPCEKDGQYSLMLAGNSTATGQALKNGGRALSVVEIPAGTITDPPHKVCLFWNSGASEFRFTQSQYVAAGGDVSKLPAYFAWKPIAGQNGGGVWLPSSTVPTAPYLTLSTSGDVLIKYALTGTAPYDVSVWGRLCFYIGPDGDPDGPYTPNPAATNADEALEQMPDGTLWRVIERPVDYEADPLTACQITDVAPGKELSAEREVYPTLWLRIDSDEPKTDLTTYTNSVNYGSKITLADTRQKVEAIVLVSPDCQPCQLPALGRRY